MLEVSEIVIASIIFLGIIYMEIRLLYAKQTIAK